MRILQTKALKEQSGSLIQQISSGKGVLILVLLCLSGGLFMGGAYFGAYLVKTTQASTLADMARGLVKQKFKIVSSYLSGLRADPVILRIDMKNNDYQKLAYHREKTLAVRGSGISQEVKDDVVSGKISVNGIDEQLPAEFSLTGANADHFGQPQKWSLRVKLKKKKLLFGMSSFTLLVPRTRARPPFTEWLNHRLNQYIGLISVRYEFVKVIFNGKDLGVYALEERYDKRLLERNERREGIIVKINNSEKQTLKFYKQKKIAESSALSEQAAHLETIWASFFAGDIPTSALFDTDKLARYYAMTDLVNGQHTHFLGNSYFYLSPITRLLEPIGREWGSPYKGPQDYRLFVENFNAQISASTAVPANLTLFHGNLFRDVEFTRKYFEYLQEFSSGGFLNAFIMSEDESIEAAKKIILSDNPYNEASTDYLFDQVDYIAAYINSDFAEGIRAYISSNNSPNEITLNSKLNFPLLCNDLRIGEQSFSIESVIGPNKATSIRMPVALNREDSHSAYIDCRVPGTDRVFAVKIFPWSQAEAIAKNLYPVSDYADNAGIESDGARLIINAGLLTLTDNLVVRKDQSLTIKAGADIDLVNGAFILSYGPLTVEGTESAPVRISSSDNTGRGVVVLNADGQNIIRHAIFSGLKPAEFPGWSVSAAVLFHETDVIIDHVLFDTNNSEDALNIVRSDFAIQNSIFDGNKSDAFDSDFSKGTIKNTRFLATGNDSIDTSGSNVEISDILISGSGDKGISVGEASFMTGQNVTVRESGIAISSKDNSAFEFENISLENNVLGFALFQKKAEYGPAQGRIHNMTLSGDGKDYLIETGSSLTIDDQLMAGDIDDVKVLMYGNVYGRKTIR
jgi:hypothetical protein